MPDLHEQFEQLDLQEIHRYVERGQQEGLQLEFKTLSPGDGFGADDRKNLAKAISGFANATGGILVWGIQAKPDASGVDTARELVPISNLERAFSDLNSHLPQATSPVPSTVKTKAIEEPDAEGYLVVHVPETMGDPWMAKLSVDRYMQRVGASFLKMEHFQIADMFGRRSRPSLALSVAITRSGIRGDTADLRVALGIANRGRSLARFPSLSLRIHKPYALDSFGLDGNGNTNLRCLHSGPVGNKRMTVYAGGANDVVHAGDILDVTAALAQVSGMRTPEDLIIEYRISALDMTMINSQYAVQGQALKMAAVADGGEPVTLIAEDHDVKVEQDSPGTTAR